MAYRNIFFFIWFGSLILKFLLGSEKGGGEENEPGLNRRIWMHIHFASSCRFFAGPTYRQSMDIQEVTFSSQKNAQDGCTSNKFIYKYKERLRCSHFKMV